LQLFATLDASMLFLPDHLGVERYTMVEFAVQYFRRPKGNSGTGKSARNIKIIIFKEYFNNL
jgi:hypothetical protein